MSVRASKEPGSSTAEIERLRFIEARAGLALGWIRGGGRGGETPDLDLNLDLDLVQLSAAGDSLSVVPGTRR